MTLLSGCPTWLDPPCLQFLDCVQSLPNKRMILLPLVCWEAMTKEER